MITLEELTERTRGYRFPDGRFTIPAYEAWLTADAIGSPHLPADVAHPMYVYYAGLIGMGISLDELFALVGSSAEEGPMFGEARIEQHRPLRIGATYVVRGEIEDAQRKEGARTGVFDIVRFRLELIAEDGQVDGVSVNSFILPRRS